jgi:hypothetical protein
MMKTSELQRKEWPPLLSQAFCPEGNFMFDRKFTSHALLNESRHLTAERRTHIF